MASPATILAEALIQSGLVSRPSSAAAPIWPVFVSHMPDTPDNAVCVYDTSGNRDGRIMRTGENIDKPGWQIRVRATGYPLAYNKILSLSRYVGTVRNLGVVINGETYTIYSVTKTGTPLSLGQEPDVKRRDAVTLNGIITYREFLT